VRTVQRESRRNRFRGIAFWIRYSRSTARFLCGSQAPSKRLQIISALGEKLFPCRTYFRDDFVRPRLIVTLEICHDSRSHQFVRSAKNRRFESTITTRVLHLRPKLRIRNVRRVPRQQIVNPVYGGNRDMQRISCSTRRKARCSREFLCQSNRLIGDAIARTQLARHIEQDDKLYALFVLRAAATFSRLTAKSLQKLPPARRPSYSRADRSRPY